jgi:hypothetical protein
MRVAGKLWAITTAACRAALAHLLAMDYTGPESSDEQVEDN